MNNHIKWRMGIVGYISSGWIKLFSFADLVASHYSTVEIQQCILDFAQNPCVRCESMYRMLHF
jgi:hypothetical protein